MVRFNGFCLCLVIFTACYSQNGVSERQFSYNDVNKIYPVVTTERFVYNKQNVLQPNTSQRYPVTIKPTPDSVTSRTDHRRYVLTTKSFNASTVTFPSKEHINVVTNRYFPNNYVDIVVGTTFLCNSQGDCNRFLNYSFCYWKYNHFETGICKCKLGYVYDGEKCLEVEDVDNCRSHSDCANLPNRRCGYVSSTKSMICLCEKDYVADKRICLAKAVYLGYCVSSKQCPFETECLDNICRHPCRSGYIWKIDTCVKELPPKIIPDIAKNNANLYITISIIIGMIMVFMFLTVSFLVRRQLLIRRSSPPADNQHNSTTESSPSTMLTELDQPPSYDDVMTASTLTLAKNAQEISDEPPPSYNYWEGDLRHK